MIIIHKERPYFARFLFIFILLFTLAIPVYSCTTADTADEQDGKSFIWKISDDDSFVYLLGSVHMASSDIYPLDSSVEDAFQESDKLVVEINLKEVGPITILALFEKYGTYPEGEGLRQNVGEQLYTQIKNRLQEMNIPLLGLDKYRPWVIVMEIEGAVMVEEEYSAEYGVDVYFMDKAEERDMEILELETAEYQFKMMSDFPDELMILMLEMSFEEPASAEDVYRLFEFWEKGDAEGMEELLFEDIGQEPALEPYYEVFLDQRNYNMMAEIEEYLADEYTYFIVVGAAHLVGEEGLLNLLAEAGYEVEQLGS